ncbi:hypothetical protein EBQ74_13245 [bacterium]|nr:hypothetical protein [bacterium]
MKVVVEVEVQMAKGDAEMKSSKVDIKAKLSVWSGIALMALALSSGKPVLAAEDIKLWHKENNERLIHLEDKDEAKSEAVEFILGKGETKADLEKFAKKFSKEPVQFLEGIKAAWTKVDKEDTSEKKDKVKEFKDKFIKDLEKVDSKAFGVDGTKEVFLDLVKKLFERKIDSESAIAELLANPLVQTALNITGKEPEVAAKSDTDKTDKTKPALLPRKNPRQNPSL